MEHGAATNTQLWQYIGHLLKNTMYIELWDVDWRKKRYTKWFNARFIDAKYNPKPIIHKFIKERSLQCIDEAKTLKEEIKKWQTKLKLWPNNGNKAKG